MDYKHRAAQLSFFNTTFWFIAISYLIITKFPLWLQDNITSNFTGAAYISLGFALIQLPFDIIGLVLYNKFKPEIRKINTLKLIKGILINIFFSLTMITLVLFLAQKMGVWFAILIIFALISLISSFQAKILNFVASANDKTFDSGFINDLLIPHNLTNPVISIKDIQHPLFKGSVSGDKKNEKITTSSYILDSLPTINFKSYIIGKIADIETNSYIRGKRFAFFANLLGFVLAAYLSNFELYTIAGLLNTILFFSLWQIFSFLILKNISIRGINESDVFCIDNHVGTEELESTIELISPQNKEGNVFYIFTNSGISAISRMKYIKDYEENPWGASNASGMMLYMSWACMGLCSRVMNYNAGCPELWIIQPNT